MIKILLGISENSLNLENYNTGIIILTNNIEIQADDIIIRTCFIVNIPVDNKMLGRVLEILRNHIYIKGPIKTK